MRLGTLRTPVTLFRRPKTSGDSDGYEEALTPSAWWASIVPYQGQTDIRATVSQVIMRYHPQIDVDTILRVPHVSYTDRVRMDGAIAYWRLDETTGLLARDAIGAAHGTISGGVTRGVPGALADGSTAMQFDRTTTGQIQTAALTVPVACTIEGWIHLAPESGTYRPLISTRQLATGSTVTIFVHDTYVDMYGSFPAASMFAPGVADDAWHHVAVVFDGTTAVIAVDGVVTGGPSAFARSLPMSGPVGIGFDAESVLYCHGRLDEVAIYPHALTPIQIAAHYAARTMPPGRERQIHVLGVQDVENRHTELLLTCEEVWP